MFGVCKLGVEWVEKVLTRVSAAYPPSRNKDRRRVRPRPRNRESTTTNVLELQHPEGYSPRMPRRLGLHGLWADHQGVHG